MPSSAGRSSTQRTSPMTQNTESLFRRLRSEVPTERLEAARYFAAHALPAHGDELREALARENVHWIRAALKRALARLSPDSPADQAAPSLDRDDIPERFAAQLYSDALEAAASQLIHEVEPLLGALRLASEREVADFDSSNTRKHLDRLDELLEAFSRLRRAASAPKIEEFALDDVVQRCIQEISVPEGVVIQKAGPQPCVVEGDTSLISICISNGLRNAIEATCATGGDLRGLPITIAWGHTDVDFWVSIVDAGTGFKGNLQRALEMGTTTKPGHLGMGLAIANQALTSMSGKLFLVPNTRGVRFEMRWPKQEKLS
jgi:signal transduction histidine kinase